MGYSTNRPIIQIDNKELSSQMAETEQEVIKNKPILEQTLNSDEVDVFLVYGQSNARGYAGNTVGDPKFKTPNVTIWNGTTTIPLTNYMPTQNGGTSTGGAWVAFANEYARLTGRNAIIANCAKGSQSIEDLQKGAANTNFSGLVSWHDGVVSHITGLGKTVGKVTMLFCQGEANSADVADTNGYLLNINQLWTDIKTDIDIELFANYTVGSYNDYRKLYAQVIQSNQREFSKNNADVITSFEDIQSLAANGMKVDGVHLNQVGYNYMGEQSVQPIVSTLFTDSAFEQSQLIKKQGVINLDASQEWKMYGAWVTTTNFLPLTTASRATSNIVATSIEVDHVAITLSDKIDYILSANATMLSVDSNISKLETGGISIKPIFDKNIYQTVDAEGRTVVKLYFVANLTVRAKMATQVIDTALQGSTLVNNVSATWGTGLVTITHPSTQRLLQANSRESVAPYVVSCTSGRTSSTVKAWDLAGVPSNIEVGINIDEIIISPATLPTGLELMFEVIGAKKRDF